MNLMFITENVYVILKIGGSMNKIHKSVAKHKTIYFIILIVILITIYIFIYNNRYIIKNKSLISLEDYKFTYEDISENKNVNVLVIMINPMIDQGKCKNLRATECLDSYSITPEENLNYQIKVLEQASHNIVNYNIVKIEEEKDFAKNNTTFKLSNGTLSDTIDKESILEISDNSLNYWQDEYFNSLPAYSFDYEYYIDKYDLVNRRNNNEFDEVWIAGDPTVSAYESIMVGNRAYWINGKEIQKNCDAFKIMYLNLSREDSFIESYGHVTENIMSNVFGATLSYEKNSKKIDSTSYNSLSLWEKFTLTEYMNEIKNTGLSGPGNIHFSPNSEMDYDWDNNRNIIQSRWQEWENYPNLKGNKSRFSPTSYSNIKLPSGTNRFPILTQHHIWWFNLIPHVTGVTKDGYSNNWWDYIITGNYITSVTSNSEIYKYKLGDKIENLSFITTSYIGEDDSYTEKKYRENMTFKNKKLIKVSSDGTMYAAQKGKTSLRYCRDGVCTSIQIEIN